MNNSNTYKMAAAAVLVVCFGLVAIIISSVFGGDEEKVNVEKKEVSVERKRSVAEDTMAEINQSKKEAAYRVEMRRRNKEMEESLNVSNEPSYIKHAPASSAPTGLSEAEKKDYEQRSIYINGQRRQLEASLKRIAKKQADGGFPVEDDYIQNELDKFDAKYGKWK